MQPLTPNERRIIEKLKNRILKSEFANADFWVGEDEIIDSNVSDKDLWLKVLSMALEHNEQIEMEWRSK